MRAALRNIVALAGLAALSGGALAWFAAHTAADAQRNRQAAESRLLRELAGIDAAAASGDLLLCDRQLVVLRCAGAGYGGAFRLAAALNMDGSVRKIRVVEHRETPGFADILDAGSAWLDSFPSGDVHAVTGATVTSEAVLAAVRRCVERVDGLCR